MSKIEKEYNEAVDKVGTVYCSNCAIKGLIDDGAPSVVEMDVRCSLIGERPYREDIQMKCTECKRTQMHGFGLTEKEFEKKLERRGKKMLDVYTDPVDSVDDEHLEALGYKI